MGTPRKPVKATDSETGRISPKRQPVNPKDFGDRDEEDVWLDEALEETFPASDPIAPGKAG